MTVEEGVAIINREMALRAHEQNHQMYADARKAALDSANSAVRAMLLVNGGAVVALLAFLGAIESGNGSALQVSELAGPIGWFGWGVGIAVLAAAVAYMVNLLDSDIISSRRGTWEHPFIVDAPITKRLSIARTGLHIFALGCGVGSLYSFGQGVFSVIEAISHLGL